MSSDGWTPEGLARLHAQCFPTHPRPWSATEFAAILSTRGTFLTTHPQGFLIGRAIAGEAELLTLATAPQARRQGIACGLLAMFDAESRARAAETAFLEVASDNAAARALYLKTGWQDAGQRRNYYAPGIDAHVMTRRLAQND